MTSNISSSSPFGEALDDAGPPLLLDLFVAMMTVVLPLLLHQRVLQPCHLVVVVGFGIGGVGVGGVVADADGGGGVGVPVDWAT